jgi:hypothetical protein
MKSMEETVRSTLTERTVNKTMRKLYNKLKLIHKIKYQKNGEGGNM